MRSTAVVLAAALSFAMGCASVRPPSVLAETTPRVDTIDEDAIREAVFQHLFKHNASGQQQSAEVYCLEIEGKKDPSSALLARLREREPKVKPASLCSFKAGVEPGVVQDDTGARGLLFRITSIRRTGSGAAEVEGGYFEAGLSASGNVYTLAKQGGRWVVVNDRMEWIS